MAFKPSQRKSRIVEEVELNLFPMMNLMCVLIPMLLSTVSFIKIGVIELNLPQAIGGPVSETVLPKEAQKGLDLALTVTSTGFYLSSSQAVLQNPQSGGPTIPKLTDGNYDFNQLSEKLIELKRKIVGGPLDTKKIILQAEQNIEYQTIVSTMDAARSIQIGETRYELFPEVLISVGII
jgi:biopolymer transport protein ExbD